MAKNKNQEPVKPESESSDEETDASSGSDEEEEQETETTFKKPTNTVTNKPSVKTPKPDSSDEDESDSDSDSEPQTTTNNNKPSSLKTHSSDESESDSDSEPKPSVTPSKRLAEPTTKSDAKKPKIVTEPEKKVPESNSKKVLFQRLWSDEDEIVILNGMIEFEAKNNVSPTSDLDKFLDYIKKDLHVNVDVSKAQLQSKIRKLKKRYENNKGKDKNLMKPHEKAAFEFSEKLWGAAASSGIVNGSVVRNTSKKGKNVKKEEVAMEVTNGDLDKKKDIVGEVSNGGLKKKALVRKMSSSFGLSNEEMLLRIGAEMFGGEGKIAGSEEWKKLEREGMELSLKELDVKRAKMKLVLDTME